MRMAIYTLSFKVAAAAAAAATVAAQPSKLDSSF